MAILVPISLTIRGADGELKETFLMSSKSELGDIETLAISYCEEFSLSMTMKQPVVTAITSQLQMHQSTLEMREQFLGGRDVSSLPPAMYILRVNVVLDDGTGLSFRDQYEWNLNRTLADTQDSLLRLSKVVVAELALLRTNHVALASQLLEQVLAGWRLQYEGKLPVVVSGGFRTDTNAAAFSPSFAKVGQ